MPSVKNDKTTQDIFKWTHQLLSAIIVVMLASYGGDIKQITVIASQIERIEQRLDKLEASNYGMVKPSTSYYRHSGERPSSSRSERINICIDSTTGTASECNPKIDIRSGEYLWSKFRGREE